MDINESNPSPSTSKAHQEIEEPLAENEPEPEPVRKIEKPLNMSPGAVKLRNWLNKSLRITMSDGRVLIGIFLCTDRDANVILGSCSEYLPEKPNSDSSEAAEEPRMLGLVMVPGKHVVSIFVDQNDDLEFVTSGNRSG